jgi:hypothetical protein
MKKSLGIAAAVGIVTALVALAPAGATTQARNVTQSRAAASTYATSHGDKAKNNPDFDYFYDYKGTNLNSICMYIATTDASGTPNGDSVNMSDYGCRNIDVSIANSNGAVVRLYYSPSEQGAWTCVPAGMSINNLNQSKYVFNSAPTDTTPGYGSPVYDDAASILVATTSNNSCNNAIGNPPKLTS